MGKTEIYWFLITRVKIYLRSLYHTLPIKPRPAPKFNVLLQKSAIQNQFAKLYPQKNCPILCRSGYPSFTKMSVSNSWTVLPNIPLLSSFITTGICHFFTAYTSIFFLFLFFPVCQFTRVYICPMLVIAFQIKCPFLMFVCVCVCANYLSKKSIFETKNVYKELSLVTWCKTLVCTLFILDKNM